MKLSARLEASNLASIDDRIMPLINIVFLLLIFFLVAGAIREVEPVEVDPPRSLVEAERLEPRFRRRPRGARAGSGRDECHTRNRAVCPTGNGARNPPRAARVAGRSFRRCRRTRSP